MWFCPTFEFDRLVVKYNTVLNRTEHLVKN